MKSPGGSSVTVVERLKQKNKKLKADNEALRKALLWYVNTDECSIDTPDYYREGKRVAQRLLGLEVDE